MNFYTPTDHAVTIIEVMLWGIDTTVLNFITSTTKFHAQFKY